MSEKTEIPPLFVYGTLMNNETMEYILGRWAISARPFRPVETVDAILPDFQAFKGDAGQKWNYIVPRLGEQTSGRLVFGLSALEIKKLDAHESVIDHESGVTQPLFTRKAVNVLTADGKSVECETYRPIFENWQKPNWRNEAEAKETARLELVRRNDPPRLMAKL